MRRELLLCLFLAFGCAEGDPAAGRAIYRTGLGADGQAIAATIAGVPLAGRAAACARCHGARGEGRKEGGIAAPPLVRHALAAYDAGSLGGALNDGIATNGRLHVTMPRYALSRRQVEDLHAYLQIVDRDREPGVRDHSIRIGAVLPEGLGAARVPLIAILESALAREGQIFHRRLELVVAGSARELEEEALALITSGDTPRPEDVPVVELHAPGLPMQARAAARLIAEALRRAGANPTRATLIDAIDESVQFSSGSSGTLPPGG